MQDAVEMLTEFGIPHEVRVVSAHRTPAWMVEYAQTAEARGLQVLIAGAGGAAHLPGMVAAFTVLPVLGVPVQSRMLSGWDSLLSIVQMPGGVPVGTLAIGKAGAKNAGLLAVRMLAATRPELRRALHAFQRQQEQNVLANSEIDRSQPGCETGAASALPPDSPAASQLPSGVSDDWPSGSSICSNEETRR